ncbi:MAG: sulfate adenylyltransferase [Phenylobacterium sp.]|nr:sulfate adenylyltransferase [Phenylobacterium sp.]
MKTQILCTLGPASLNRDCLSRLSALQISLFRLNLSHTRLEDIPRFVETIREASRVPICLDSEGAQVRTGRVRNGAILKENSFVRIQASDILGDDKAITLTPPSSIPQLVVGDILTIDFNSCAAQVVQRSGDEALLRVLSGGLVGSNKAVSLQREITLPAISPKDRLAIELGRQLGITHFALSFASTADDVAEMRALAGPGATIISKIESLRAIANLDAIMNASDAVLIDRGDLSRQVPLERIPAAQKYIIGRAVELGRKCYVATNLAESMVVAPAPTRAEVNDIWNTLADGASGLVLAAETAIGRYPVQCAAMVRRVANEFADRREFDVGADPSSLLPLPHGGRLQECWLTRGDCDGLRSARELVVSVRTLLDAEQIALGFFSPLDGFMDLETLRSVLHRSRLQNDLPWTMPILLPVAKSEQISVGERIKLCGPDGRAYALLHVSERFAFDLGELAQLWFGTTTDRHPGVSNLNSAGGEFLAGKIELIERVPSAHALYSLSPTQSRFMFEHRGWSRVVAFHTRNVIHRAHEFIQLAALDRSAADGLFLNPLVGPSKSGDFRPEAVIASYRACIDAGVYPTDRAALAAWTSWPRYAGPREAVFTALVRKNLGCSHIVVGRDHSGVGDFYQPRAYDELFESLGDLGIEPVMFEAVGYDPVTSQYVEGAANTDSISGTGLRAALARGDAIPEWAMRKEVVSVLSDLTSRGQALFVE